MSNQKTIQGGWCKQLDPRNSQLIAPNVHPNPLPQSYFHLFKHGDHDEGEKQDLHMKMKKQVLQVSPLMKSLESLLEKSVQIFSEFFFLDRETKLAHCENREKN